MTHILGRKRETQKLNDFLNSNKSEFMAVYGRRRVGKTYLINQYFKRKEGQCKYFSATGINSGLYKDQKSAFCSELSEAFFHGAPIEVPKTWFKVFEVLDKVIKTTPGKFIIFLDEFPWMSTPKSKLLQTLEYFWNQRWNSYARIKLIICGSLSSWVIRNVIENTGGLYHRVTYRLSVNPFKLSQTKEFLKKNNHVNLTYSQIINIYNVLGGIPLYLEQVKKGESANQVIDQICFTREGLLFDEMNELFKSLFNDSSVYMDITRIIAKHRYGISKKDLSKKTKISRGGRFNDRLRELEETGFIQSFLPYQNKERGAYYRIIDEYTNFYFFWMEPDIRTIKRLGNSSGYWALKSKESRHQSWKGYAFEAICYKSTAEILKALNLESTCIPYTWKHITKSKDHHDSGTQIDLLFDRSDDAITLCEIKCTNKPFLINKEYYFTLKKKIEVFRKITKTKKQIFFAMITTNGIKKNKYSLELVDKEVSLEDLFKDT